MPPKRGLAAKRKNEDEEQAPQKKKTLEELSSPLNPAVFEKESKDTVKDYLKNSTPYPHFVIHDLVQPERLRAVRDEIITHIRATFKETDIYKLLQTGDLANLEALEPEQAALVPELMALKKALYGDEFRNYIIDITGCDDIIATKMDCSCNVYLQGHHLLCHDDVIGTRRVSWIIYLTDPDEEWTEQDGGALELYPLQEEGVRGVPTANPTRNILPRWNQMVAFTVQPGISFHAVQEVFSPDKPRLSISGWFHADVPPEHHELATLNQLESKREDAALPFTPLPHDAPDLTPEETALLQQWINPTYLDPKTIEKVQEQFYEENSIQLHHFLSADVARRVQRACREADQAAGLGMGGLPGYNAGVGEGWDLVGPSHKQRYLAYRGQGGNDRIGPLMRDIQKELFSSPAFAAWLAKVCQLQVTSGRGLARRFRPGLDYTIAHYGAISKDTRLDATLCLVDSAGERAAVWEEGEFGGFESYIMAEDEGEGKAEAAEVYKSKADDEDSGLLQVSPSFNTLNLVLRDPGVMKFIKYLSAAAPGSRFDITNEYEVVVPEGSSDEEGDEEAEAGQGEEEGARDE